MEKLDYVGGFEYSTVKSRIEELKEFLKDASELERKSNIDFSKAKIANAEIEVLKAKKELAEFEKKGQEELDKIQEQIDKKTELMNSLRENAEKMRDQVLTASDNLESIQRSVDTRINELKERDPDISTFVQDTLKEKYMQEMENVDKEEAKYKEDVKKVRDAKGLMSNSEVQTLLSKIIQDKKSLKEINVQIKNASDEKGKKELIQRRDRLNGYMKKNRSQLEALMGNDKSINLNELIEMASDAAEYKNETKTEIVKRGKNKGKEIKKTVKVIDFEKTLNNVQEPAEKDFASEKAVYEKLIKEIEKEQEIEKARNRKREEKNKKKSKEQYQDGGNGKKEEYFQDL